MINYERVKKHFADKLAADFAGQGRFESAFYHTIKMVHDTVSAENAERIAVLEADIKTLCVVLDTTVKGNARMKAAGRAVVERWGSPLWKDLPHTGEYIAALRDAMDKA